MLEFALPWAWLLLPLPLLVYRFAPPYRERRESIQVPFFRRLVQLSGVEPGRGAVILQRIVLQRILLPIAWVLMVAALAAPEWIGAPQSMSRSARDLMIAVDLSGSMQARDFVAEDGQAIDRLQAVKKVLGEFVALRAHDRLGLILFGDAPYLQAPFTTDHVAWLELLQQTAIGMAGQSTVFGDAIGLAIRIFSTSESKQRVLVVLTDGNDTGSKVPPVEAAKVAREHGIRIYTIAIGDPATIGEEALDSAVLERVAQLSGGRSYSALDRAQLAAAWRAIDALEPEEFETLSFRPRSSLFHLPLGAVFVLYLVFHGVMNLLAWRRAVRGHHA